MSNQYLNTSLFKFWGTVTVLLLILTGCGTSPDIQPPQGMVYFEGGPITIGSESGELNEGPSFSTNVEPFFLDIHPVTVAQFRKFVEETDYETDAEQFGNSAVFDFDSGRWKMIEGAYWEYPLGTDGPRAQDDHPVTQVSWNDAQAYCEWAGRRLPTEVEWEYAAKGGKDSDNLYSWGNELIEKSTYKANVWQGSFPHESRVEDGYRYTSPVGAFGKTEAGLTDMGGNVWEWTSDTYHLYKGNDGQIPYNPNVKVIRGGSFLCDEDVCHGYRVTARQYNSRESATINMGFRTAKDVR